MKKFIKKGFKYQILLLSSVITTLFLFGINFIPNYGPDTYATITSSQTAHMFYGNARPLNAVVYWIFERIHLPFYIVFEISFISALIFCSLAVYQYGEIILKYVILNERNAQSTQKEEVLCGILSAVTISNLFSVEYFLYIEMGLFFFSIFLSVVAVEIFTKGLFNNCLKKFDVLKIFLCLIASISIYQIIPGQYVVMSLPFIALYVYRQTNKKVSSFFKINIIMVLPYILVNCLQILYSGLIVRTERLTMQETNLVNDALTYMPKETSSVKEFILMRIPLGWWIYGGLCIALVLCLLYQALRCPKQLEHIFYGIYLTVGTAVVGGCHILLKFLRIIVQEYIILWHQLSGFCFCMALAAD